MRPEERAEAVGRDCDHRTVYLLGGGSTGIPCRACIASAIEAAVAVEREACARLADMQSEYMVSVMGGNGPEIHQRENHTAKLIARQIRMGLVV